MKAVQHRILHILRELFDVAIVILAVAGIVAWNRVEACGSPAVIDWGPEEVHHTSLITPFSMDSFGSVTMEHWEVLYRTCGGGKQLIVLEQTRSVVSSDGEVKILPNGYVRLIAPYYDHRL